MKHCEGCELIDLDCADLTCSVLGQAVDKEVVKLCEQCGWRVRRWKSDRPVRRYMMCEAELIAMDNR